MTPFQALGFSLGTSFASGLNLYATVAVLGLLHRLSYINLPPRLEVLANPWVLGVAITLYVVEFVADKIPYVDSVWDVVHTFIRPPAAALLAYGAVGPVDDAWRWAAALMAGSVALASHGTKATTRAAVNTSPEPFSNWTLSVSEDALALGLTWMAVTHPLLTAGIVAGLLVVCLYLVMKLFRFLLRALRRIFGQGASPATPPGNLPARG